MRVSKPNSSARLQLAFAEPVCPHDRRDEHGEVAFRRRCNHWVIAQGDGFVGLAPKEDLDGEDHLPSHLRAVPSTTTSEQGESFASVLDPSEAGKAYRNDFSSRIEAGAQPEHLLTCLYRSIEVSRVNWIAPFQSVQSMNLGPNFTPRSLARMRPSPVRDRIKSRSNSANPPIAVSIKRPYGLVVVCSVLSPTASPGKRGSGRLSKREYSRRSSKDRALD